MVSEPSEVVASETSEADEACQSERRPWKRTAVLLAVGLAALGALAALARVHGHQSTRGRLGPQVQLLEVGSHSRNSQDEIWEQVLGVAAIEKRIQKIKLLQGEMDKLVKSFPVHALIKAKFGDKWDDMMVGSNFKQWQAQVTEAQNAGNNKHVAELQAKLEDMTVDYDLMKAHAETIWKEKDMPNSHKLHEQVQEAAKNISLWVSDATRNKLPKMSDLDKFHERVTSDISLADGTSDGSNDTVNLMWEQVGGAVVLEIYDDKLEHSNDKIQEMIRIGKEELSPSFPEATVIKKGLGGFWKEVKDAWIMDQKLVGVWEDIPVGAEEAKNLNEDTLTDEAKVDKVRAVKAKLQRLWSVLGMPHDLNKLHSLVKMPADKSYRSISAIVNKIRADSLRTATSNAELGSKITGSEYNLGDLTTR